MASTIDKTYPGPGVDITSIGLLSQFRASANDIEALQLRVDALEAGGGGGAVPADNWATSSVSAFALLSPVYTDDYVPVVRGGVAYRATVAALLGAIANPGTGGGLESLPTSFASVNGFGNSIINGVGSSTQNLAWLYLMATALGATVTNNGIPGTVLQNSPDATGSPRANNGRDRFVAALTGANKKALTIIAYGFNDLRYTGAPGTFNLTAFTNDYREVLNGLRIRGILPSEILIVAPYYGNAALYSTGSTGFTGSNATIHAQYVAACKALADEYGTFYFDAYAYMQANGGDSLIGGDNIHPNDAGHGVIAQGARLAKKTVTFAAITGLSCSSPAAGQLNVTFNAYANALSYQVQCGLTGTEAFATTASSTTNAYSFTGLTAGSYYARVRAVLAGNQYSPWQFITSAVTVAASGAGDTLVNSDTFTGQTAGAVIGSQSPTTGSWTKHPSSTGDAIFTADDALKGPAGAGLLAIHTFADMAFGIGQYAQMNVKHLQATDWRGNLSSALVLRADATNNTMLACVYNGVNIRIWKVINGVITTIGTYVVSFAANSTHEIRFEVRPSQQKVFVDGTLVLTTTEPETNLTAMSTLAGLRLQEGPTITWPDGNGPDILNIEVGQLGA